MILRPYQLADLAGIRALLAKGICYDSPVDAMMLGGFSISGLPSVVASTTRQPLEGRSFL